MFWPQFKAAIEGDREAAAVCLGIMARRSRLRGLDMPVRTQVTGANNEPLIPNKIELTADEAAMRLWQFLNAHASEGDTQPAISEGTPGIY
jgi:hypothetical protein